VEGGLQAPVVALVEGGVGSASGEAELVEVVGGVAEAKPPPNWMSPTRLAVGMDWARAEAGRQQAMRRARARSWRVRIARGPFILLLPVLLRRSPTRGRV